MKTLSPVTKNGFTLVEVVITVGLMALLLAALASVFGTFSSLQSYQQAFSGVTSDAGAVIHAIESSTLPADSVLTSYAFAAGTYTSSANVLVLELPSVDSAGAIITGNHDYVAFYLTGTTAYERVELGAGSARRAGVMTLGGRIASLMFTYDSASLPAVTTVTAAVVASTSAKGTMVEDRLTELMRLRNH